MGHHVWSQEKANVPQCLVLRSLTSSMGDPRRQIWEWMQGCGCERVTGQLCCVDVVQEEDREDDRGAGERFP